MKTSDEYINFGRNTVPHWIVSGNEQFDGDLADGYSPGGSRAVAQAESRGRAGPGASCCGNGARGHSGNHGQHHGRSEADASLPPVGCDNFFLQRLSFTSISKY